MSVRVIPPFLAFVALVCLVAGAGPSASVHAEEAAPAAGTGTPAASPVRLRVRSDIETNDRVVRLGDLVPDAPPEISGLVVADAPVPGGTAVLSLAEVRSALLRAGYMEYEVGSGRVTVRRSGRRVSRSRVERRLSALVGERLDGTPVRVTLSGFRPFALPIVGAGGEVADYRLSLIDLDEERGRFQARLSFPDGFGGTRIRTLAGRYETMVEVPVLRRTVAAGEILRASDVVTRPVVARRLGRGMILDLRQIVGRAATRPLRANVPLRQGDVERPVLVRKGTLVTMQVRQGAMVLSALGKAMQDGALGDRILLLNPRTRRTVEGTVVAAGRVEIAVMRTAMVARADHGR